MLGVIAGAAAIGPILNLLFQAYGIGGHFPRPDMDPTAALAAPQAPLMQSVALGVFERQLPWDMILAGAALAILVITCDQILKYRNSHFRMPVLAVAIGLYLPVELTLPIFLGGAAAQVAATISRSRPRTHNSPTGLLLASGLIAGEALAGIALAIPFALARNTNVLRIAGDAFTPIATTLATLIVCSVLTALARSKPNTQ
jgi:putative OPT family oligopeptide transporter